MIAPMEIVLVERNGNAHELMLPQVESVSSDWLRELCAKFFQTQRLQHKEWETHPFNRGALVPKPRPPVQDQYRFDRSQIQP